MRGRQERLQPFLRLCRALCPSCPAVLPGSMPVPWLCQAPRLSHGTAGLRAHPAALPGSRTIPQLCQALCPSRPAALPCSMPVLSCSSAGLRAHPAALPGSVLVLSHDSARLCAHPIPQLRRGRTKHCKDHAARAGTALTHLQACGRGILGNVYYTGSCLESSFFLIIQLSV